MSKKRRKRAKQSLQLCRTQTERRSQFDLFVRDFTYVLFMVLFSEVGGGAVFDMECLHALPVWVQLLSRLSGFLAPSIVLHIKLSWQL